MKKIEARRLRVGRRMAVEHGSDILHALACSRCGLRAEALVVLTMLGWDEGSFTEDYFEWLLRAR